MLDIQKEIHGTVVVLSLKGQLDALTAGSMKPIVDDLMDSKTTKIVFDLHDVTLIDSSGVGAIVSVFKRTRSWNGNTIVSGLSAQPLEVFKLLKLDKVIRIFTSVEQALASFTS
jgi:anti-sigma B factor antagonist